MLESQHTNDIHFGVGKIKGIAHKAQRTFDKNNNALQVEVSLRLIEMEIAQIRVAITAHINTRRLVDV